MFDAVLPSPALVATPRLDQHPTVTAAGCGTWVGPGERNDVGPAGAIPIPPMPDGGGIPVAALPLAPSSPAPAVFPPQPDAAQPVVGPAEATMPASPTPFAPWPSDPNAVGAPAPSSFPTGAWVGTFGKPGDSADGLAKAPARGPSAEVPTGPSVHPPGAIDLRQLGIEVPPTRRRVPRWAVIALGYGTSAVLGLGLAYLVIRWLFPGSRLPSLW